jgi:hypothetical protein
VLGDKLRHEMFLSCVRVQLSSQEYCVARSGVSVWINAGVVESLGRWKQRREASLACGTTRNDSSTELLHADLVFRIGCVCGRRH